MPDKEFIHSTSDVVSTLLYALDAGFEVRSDEPQPEPRPCLVSAADVPGITGGVFFLSRPEWVFGPLQMMQISGGYYAGQYTLSPGVNWAKITLYFQGEGMKDERRRFGSGLLSFNHDWLAMPDKVLMQTPAEVKVWWNRIAAHMLSKVAVKAGVHRYHICKGVLDDPAAAECLPPFDYIPWGERALER